VGGVGEGVRCGLIPHLLLYFVSHIKIYIENKKVYDGCNYYRRKIVFGFFFLSLEMGKFL
jgi:hypothetical protein